MKHLKYIFVLAALFAVPLTVNAATASAANCHFTSSPITFSGYLNQTLTAYGCTDVDLVEWTAWTPTSENFVDASAGGTHHLVSVPPTVFDVLCGRTGVSFTGQCGHILHVSPWCPPMTPHVVYGAGLVRIHRLATETWGVWNWSFSQNYTIWC